MRFDIMDTHSVIVFYILLHSAYCDLSGRVVEFGGPPSAYKIPSISGGPFISRIEDLYGGTIRCSPDHRRSTTGLIFFLSFSPVWRPLRYVHAIILPLKPFLSILNQPSSMGYYIDKVGNAVS